MVFDKSNEAVDFKAMNNSKFVLGSAFPHEHSLVVGHYSVHTTKLNLRCGEVMINAVTERLKKALTAEKKLNTFSQVRATNCDQSKKT